MLASTGCSEIKTAFCSQMHCVPSGMMSRDLGSVLSQPSLTIGLGTQLSPGLCHIETDGKSTMPC